MNILNTATAFFIILTVLFVAIAGIMYVTNPDAFWRALAHWLGDE